MKIQTPKVSLFAICLTASCALAQWEEITDRVPESPDSTDLQPPNSSDFFITPTFPATFEELYPVEGAIVITRTDNILISLDDGETFQSTNAPFHISSSFFFGSSGPSPVQYLPKNGDLLVLAHETASVESNSAVYQLDVETLVWTKILEILPGYDRETYGELKFYDQCEVTGNHYTMTTLREEILGSSFFQEYNYTSSIWILEDGSDWEQIDLSAYSFGNVRDFFCLDERLYLMEGDNPFVSADGGASWSAVDIPLSKEPFVYRFINRGPDFYSNYVFSVNVFFDEEIGVSFNFQLDDPETESTFLSKLPMVGLNQISTQAAYIIAVGGVLYSENPEYIYPAFFTSNNGLSWDRIDLTGIQLHGPQTDPFNIQPVSVGIDAFLFSDTYAFILAEDRLWRRPINELDLRHTTRILKHPEHSIGDPGDTIILEVKAVGEGDLSYQWHRDGEKIPESDSNQLLFSSLSSNDKGNYTVTVTGENGSETSHQARVDVALDFETFAEQTYPIGKQSPTDDGSNNGVSNLEEFLFGIESVTEIPKGSVERAADIGLFSSDSYLTLSIQRRLNAANLRPVARAAMTVDGLTSGEDLARQVGDSYIDGDFEIITYRSTFTTNDSATGYMQIVLEED